VVQDCRCGIYAWLESAVIESLFAGLIFAAEAMILTAAVSILFCLLIWYLSE
jgi:hypothetical protein